MIDHHGLIRELFDEYGEGASALERDLLRVRLIEHLADSSHRMALPHSWSREQVIEHLDFVFAGDPFIEHVLDVLVRELS